MVRGRHPTVGSGEHPRCFVEKLVAEVAALRVGPEADATSGPITTHAQYEKIQSYFEVAKREGLTCAIGGTTMRGGKYGDGWYIAPTVYTGVSNDDVLAREEIFGPVVVVIPFTDEADAIRIASDSDFGLRGDLEPRHRPRTSRLRLDAGRIVVNEYSGGFVQSPCGGFKQNGYGREQGIDALGHYTQLKSVIIKI
jgi:aldehyde dehydrogenase (NAD+)